MSIAVGVTDGQTVCIGVDSFAAMGIHQRTRIEPKMVSKYGMLIACVGNLLVPQILKTRLNLESRPRDTDPSDYMVGTFVSALRGLFRDEKIGELWSGEKDEQAEGDLLVGLNGHLFVVYADYQVEEMHTRYNAVGSAAPYALGALFRTYNMCEQQLPITARCALEACLEFSSEVRQPFHVWILRSDGDLQKYVW